MTPSTRRPRTTRPLFRKPTREDSSFTDEHRKLVYDTSRWQSFLYDMREKATAKAEKDLGEPLREDQHLAKAKKGEVEDFAHALGKELFGRLYGDPARLDEKRKDAPGWMDLVHETLDSMQEWDTLRKQVHGDPDFSALATNAMLTSLQPRLAELIKQRQEEEQQQAQGDGEGGQGGQGQGGSDSSMPTAQDAMRAALRGACQDATDGADAGKSALGGIAPGLDSTPPNDLQKETDRFDLIQAIMHDPDFQEIARKAGRLRRISGRTTETRKSKDVYEEVVDVETGNDLTRLLPSEIMNLMDPDLEILELSRIVDGTALQYRLEGHEPQGRGPMIYIRDVSGSMYGQGHQWGAAVGVALTSQVTREKRSMRSACFNGGVHNGRLLDETGLHEYDMSKFEARGWNAPRGYAQVQALQLKGRLASGRLATAQAAMCHAKDGVDGGTDFGPAMRWAMLAGLEEPRADFVFLTDGQAYIDEATLARLNAAKERGLRVFGMTVNGGSVSPAVNAICDEVIDIDACKSEDDVAKSLGKMLRRSRA